MASQLSPDSPVQAVDLPNDEVVVAPARSWKEALLLGLICLLAMALKAALILTERVPFNSDEAVVALMARHILQGERPVFFYGQAYMGSLDAWLVALAFRLLGQQIWAIRLVQALLYMGTMVSTYLLGKAIWGSKRVGLLAALLLAVPTVNVTLYTTASLGGYGEALLLGNLILLVAWRGAQLIDRIAGSASRAEQPPGGSALRVPRLLLGLAAGLGFLIGLGLWAFGLTLVYALPALGLWAGRLWQRRQVLRAERGPILAMAGLMTLGAGLGAAPWWGYALQFGLERLLAELGGGAIAGVEGLPWIFQVGQHLLNLLLLGITVTFGLRPPWDVVWLALPLLPFVLMFWGVVLIDMMRRLRQLSPAQPGMVMVAAVMLVTLVAFILTPFGADPSGRYFLPLAVPLALFAAAYLVDRMESPFRPSQLRGETGKAWPGWAALGLALLPLVYNLWGTWQCARTFPPGLTTQFYAPARLDQRAMPALIAFLRQQGEKAGYTNYWVSYPLAFLSQEELIFVPRLPYHPDFRYTSRDDRYPPYDDQVAQAERVAYIVTNHPALEERLRQSFQSFGVTWQEAQIGDFRLFYALSRPVRPEEMGLGQTTP